MADRCADHGRKSMAAAYFGVVVVVVEEVEPAGVSIVWVVVDVLAAGLWWTTFFLT